MKPSIFRLSKFGRKGGKIEVKMFPNLHPLPQMSNEKAKVIAENNESIFIPKIDNEENSSENKRRLI